MVNKTYWGQIIDQLVLTGETDCLSTGAIAVLNKLAAYASPLSSVVTISVPMLSDLNGFSQDATERYIDELVAKKVIVRQKHQSSSDYALHNRLFSLSGEISVA